MKAVTNIFRLRFTLMAFGCLALTSAVRAVNPPPGEDQVEGNSATGDFNATTVTESTLANISTRAFVQTGDNVVIGGFIVEGAEKKSVIIRAIGQELTQYGVPNALANPTLELHDTTGALIASNNNWVTTIIGGIITSSQVHEIQASGFAPTDPFESAIIADLPAGKYTAIVRGVNNLTGVALVEVYDLSPETNSFLGDISTRSYVQTGANVMIGGFTIPGTKPKGVMLRAIGPDLSKYGIPNTLTDPTLELYDSTGALIASNDSWQHTTIGGIIAGDQVRDILNSGLPPGDRNESAINATLVPGNYTAIVRGVNNTTGVALLDGRRVSATYTWTGAVDSHWENPGNWEPHGVPQSGDTAAISSGTSNSPAVSEPHINDVQIVLGSPDGGSVTLSAASVTLTVRGPTVTGGVPGPSPVNATLSCQGNVTFALAGKREEKKGVEGIMTVEPMAGALTIDAGDGTFTLTDSGAKTDLDATKELGTDASSRSLTAEFKALVTQESSLFFKGRNIVTKRVVTDRGTIVPIIEIEGATDIAEGVTLGGEGILSLDSGGHLSIKGTVEPGERIVFADGTGRVSIGNPTAFAGTLGFTPVAGARMDFPGIEAQSVGVLPSPTGGRLLTLYAGPNQTGGFLAQINVETISEGSLLPTHPHPPTVPLLAGRDFALSSNGKGGTLVTYLPQGTAHLEQSMPVPVIAFRDTKVPLRTIFSQSFGTSTPGFYNITLLPPSHPTNTPTDFKYWGSFQVPPAWFVNDRQITKKHKFTNTDRVELLVGNNISDPAQFEAQVTRASTGPESEIVTYSVWTVDPAAANRVGSIPGKPAPADIIASAHSLDSTFPDVPNTNLCNWIADNVAATAGAAVPLPDAEGDPTDNVGGGFWRIAYTGAGPNPVRNWFRLMMPGDFVRLEKLFGGFHTTTALTGQHANGTITVYSNGGGPLIGIHPSTVEEIANPASITMYRLDPNQQYLILGTSLGEVIQGSVYNNLFRPGGGADVIIAGPNNNEIRDKTSNLDGIRVRNFHSGDILNFTDLHPTGTTAQYDATTGVLSVSDHGQQVAAIIMRGLNANAQFLVTPNPPGSNITISN
jgi:hypothetical protein